MMPREPVDEVTSRALFPELDLDKMNRAEKVVVRTDEETIELLRDEQFGWVVAQLDNYPAETAQLRTLFNVFLEVEKVEEKTSDPAFYARLGVADPESPEGGGTLVAVTVEGIEYAVILGELSPQMSTGQFVRKPEEETSWLVNRRFRVSKTPNRWVETEIFHIPREDIQTIKVDYQAAGGSFAFVRDAASGKLQLEHDRAGESPADDIASDLDELVALVDHMEFRQLGVRENLPSAVQEKGIEAAPELITAEYATLGQMIVRIGAYRHRKINYFDIVVVAGTEASAAAREQVAQITALISGRVYEVSNATYNEMAKSAKTILSSLEAVGE